MAEDKQSQAIVTIQFGQTTNDQQRRMLVEALGPAVVLTLTVDGVRWRAGGPVGGVAETGSGLTATFAFTEPGDD
jgi:hypothetical protein